MSPYYEELFSYLLLFYFRTATVPQLLFMLFIHINTARSMVLLKQQRKAIVSG